ncbi:hypothetical protein PoB_004911300 [Plakobranchus ocellatus]|uniref:Uncharacterized protein n=1 Tax=Plakobranchus ocellatus TaxID=259542 RepID=A0AAV4BTU7_9GAST|nr:hypothetical protein PoB_004911300 [Plakobranchus ocellatus]
MGRREVTLLFTPWRKSSLLPLSWASREPLSSSWIQIMQFRRECGAASGPERRRKSHRIWQLNHLKGSKEVLHEQEEAPCGSHERQLVKFHQVDDVIPLSSGVVRALRNSPSLQVTLNTLLDLGDIAEAQNKDDALAFLKD